MLAVVVFSLAVSIKMNVLLMAPGVLAVMIKARRTMKRDGDVLLRALPFTSVPLIIIIQAASPADLVAAVGAGGLVQVVLGAPFLLHNPASYMSKAFEFSRVGLKRALESLHVVQKLMLCCTHPFACRSSCTSGR